MIWWAVFSLVIKLNVFVWLWILWRWSNKHVDVTGNFHTRKVICGCHTPRQVAMYMSLWAYLHRTLTAGKVPFWVQQKRLNYRLPRVFVTSTFQLVDLFSFTICFLQLFRHFPSYLFVYFASFYALSVSLPTSSLYFLPSIRLWTGRPVKLVLRYRRGREFLFCTEFSAAPVLTQPLMQ
jgi:hypothetical protein